MISIVIPTLNEAKNITDLVERLKKCLTESYELIIVDDASADGTGDIAEQLGRDHPVKLVHRAGKLGLFSAVLDGIKVSRGDLIAVMDSDLSHPPETIPLLLKRMKEQNADIIIGSRFTKGGASKNCSQKRLLATRLAILTVWPLTRIKDPMAGFFICKKEVIQSVDLIPRGFKILLEILVKGRYKKALEYPIVFVDRVHGTSKISPRVYSEFIAQLLDLYLFKIKSLFKAHS